MRAGSTQAFGTGTMTVNAGGTLDVNNQSLTIGSLAGSGTVTNLGTSALTLSGGTSTFSGVIGGSGALIRTGPGFQTFSGCNNTYTGATTISSGTISTDCLADGGFASGIGASGNASSNLVFIGGRLTYTGANVSIDRGFTLESGNNFLNVNDPAASLEFEGVVTGAGTLNKEGAGTLVLSGANTHTGNIRVFAGVLRAGADNAFGPQGYMTLDNTAGVLLDLNDNDAVVTALIGGGANGGNIDLGSGTLTIAAVDVRSYAGAISGTGDLVMTANVNNAGRVQELTNCSSTYDGTTTVSSGVLAVSCLNDGGLASSIGDSGNLASNLVINGGTLRYSGAGGSTDRLFTLGSSTNSKIEASGTGALAFTNTGAIAFASPGTAQTIRLGGTNTGDNSFALQITNNAGGVTSFTKEDAGTWRLSNAGSTYTGVTSILGGVLSVDKLANGGVASSIGQSALDATNLVIGSGSTLRYTGAGDSTNRLFTLQTGVTFIESSGTGAIAFTNTGTMGFQGSGTRIFALGGTNIGTNIMGVSITDGTGGATTLAKNDAGNWYLTGNSTYTGPTNVNAGTLFIGNGGTTGSITSNTVNVTGFGALGFNRSDAVTYAGTIQGSGGVTQAGTGTTILTGNSTYTGGTTISAGTLQLGNGGATGSIAGNVANSGTLALNRNNAYTFGGTITGAGTIAQIGTGTTTFTAANTAGATTISAGTLNVNGALTTQTVAMTGTSTLNVNATLGAAAGGIATLTGDTGASTINVASGITLRAAGDLGGGNDVINVAGTLNTGAGTFSLGAGNDTFVLSGGLIGRIDGGADTDALQVDGTLFRVFDSANVTGFETLTKNDISIVALTGDHSFVNGVTVTGGTLQIGTGGATGTLVGDVANSGTLRFNRTGTSTYSGAISGTGLVQHNGSGTTVFTGNSSYTGATNVNAGTLLINGNQSGATGLTSVASGATLGGTGTIGGNVTIAGGGTLAAGANGVGALTINGNLTLADTTQLSFEFGQAGVPGGLLNDLVNVGGDLTLDGTLNVTQSAGGTFGPGVYRMFNYAGTLTDNGLTVGSPDYLVQTSVANQVNLVNSAGLTLSFWDGDAGPHADGTISGGSGTWRAAGDVNWTDSTGVFAAPFANASFAVFQGVGGTVAVDNANGQVEATGMQFAVNGYTVQGGDLTLVDDISQAGLQSVIRVGDGTAAGAGYTATIASDLAGATQLVKTDAGTLVLSGTNSYTGGTAINGGTLRISSDANLGDAAGALSLNGGTLNTTASLASARAVDLVGAGTSLTDTGTTFTLSGIVSGAGTLTKDGAGSLVLTNANTYAGGTTITAGTLQLGNGGTSGSIAGNVTNNGALAFNRSDNLTFAGTITGSGAVNQIGSGTTILTADNGYAGGTTISAGTLQLGNGGTTGSVAGNVVNGGTLIFNRSNEYSFAGTISGAGAVRQEGTGTTIQTADNSYTGSTVISSGTLLINGNQAAAVGTTNVLGGGALGGTGTIGGDVFVGGGATLTPGDATGPGTLTINGNLGFSPNATLAYEFGQSNIVGGPLNDLTEVAGNLTLDGTIDVTLAPGGSFGQGLYRVISYGGLLTDNGLTLGAMPAGSTVAVQTSVSGQVNLINAVGGTFNFWDGAAPANESNNLVDGGSGTWQNSSGNNDWTTHTGAVSGPYTDGAFAIFAAASGTVNVDNGLGTVTASGLQFASDGYTIAGQDLTLVGPQSTIRVGDGTALGFGYTATIDAALIGSTQLVKADLGTLVLSGINTYTAGTRIDAGTLRISSDANLGDATGALAFNGGTLNTTADIASNRAVNLLGTGTFLTDTGTTLTLNGTVTGAGGLTKGGAGALVLTAANAYLGDTVVGAGSLFVNGDQSAATGLTSVASGATLGGSGIIGGNVTLADGAKLAAGTGNVGTLAVDGNLALGAGSVLDFEFGEANVAGGSLNDLVEVGGDLTLDGTINVSVPAGGSFGPGIYRVFNYTGALTDNGLTLGTLPGGSAVSVQTAVSGQVNLVNTAGLTLSFWDGDAGPKNDGAVNGGDGVWRVGGGSNNWTNSNGALNADYAQDSFAIFAGAPGTVTVDNAGGNVLASDMQFATDGYTITGDMLTLTGTNAIVQVGDGSFASNGYTATIAAEFAGGAQLVKTDAGTLVLTGANSYTGGTAINGGTVRIASDANLGATTGGLSLDGGTLNTTADLTSARAIELAGSGTFLTDPGTALTLSGAITGTGSLVKTGTGTLTLSGTGGYMGATNVNVGTLLVNGDYTGAIGLVSVASGANLGGTGMIGGDVSLADGATLTPGASGAGTFTISGDVSLAAGTTLAYEFGTANVAGGALNDLVDIGGDLTLDGTINVTVPAGGAFDVGVYRVFNYGGTLTNNGLTLGTLPIGSDVTVQTSIAGQVNLVNSAGLSFNFWDGVAGPTNNGAIDGGDGTWQASGGNDNWANANGTLNAAYSDGAFAVFGGTGGTVTVDNSLGQVTASGMQFAANGYTISGDEIALTGPQSTIRVGDGSTAGAGFTATINGPLLGDTQLVKTDAGMLVLGGTNSYTGGTLINGGTVQISADANLGAASGAVTFDGGTLATSANVTSTRDIMMTGAGTISAASGTTFTFNGLLSGTGALTNAGTGTLLLTGNSSGFVGSTTVEGTMIVNGSLCGDVTVAAGGRLGGTGTICTTVNAGTIAPGNSIGTLTIAGTYTGNNGVLEMEVELGGDGSPTDRLVVTNGTAGSTEVAVINRGGLGAQTNEGIKIVDVTGGASNGTFTLRGDYDFEGSPAVIAGAYGYRLFQGGVSTPADGDWYLRSALLDAPNEPQAPLYQPGVPLYESYVATLQTLNRLGTLQERIGNRQWSGFTEGGIGMWGRIEGTRYRPEAAFSTSGSDLDVNDWSLQAGFDKALDTSAGTLIAGVNGRYGKADAQVRSRFGSGKINTQGIGVGATLTWYDGTGFYADAQAQVSWYRSDLDSTVLGELVNDNHGSGEAFSLEVGKRAPLGGDLSVTPQIQMTYSNVRFDRFADPNDAMISSDRADSLKTRWGISLDHQKTWDGANGAKQSQLYGIVNLNYEWLDGSVVDVSGTSIARRDDRLWGEVGIGGSYSWGGGRYTLFSEISANTAINNFGDSNSLRGNAGFRMRF